MRDHRSTLQSMSSALLIALVCWATPLHGWAQEDEIIAGGKIKYQQYCANCHGATGKGDGEMAALMVFKPTNLTQLSKQNKGEFPFWRVYRAIDGREHRARSRKSRDAVVGFCVSSRGRCQRDQCAIRSRPRADLATGIFSGGDSGKGDCHKPRSELGADDLIQSFNDLSKFLRAYLSKSLADALNRERANLTDLSKNLISDKV